MEKHEDATPSMDQEQSEHFFLIKGIKYKLNTAIDWKTRKIHQQIEQLEQIQEKSKKKRKNRHDHDREIIEKPSKKIVPLYEDASCESEWKKLMDLSDIMWNVLQFLEVDDICEMLIICKRWKQIILEELNGAWKAEYLSCLGIENGDNNDENYFKIYIQFQRTKALNFDLVDSVYYWEESECGFSEWEGFSEIFEKYNSFVHIVKLESQTVGDLFKTIFTIIAYNFKGNEYSVKFEGVIRLDDHSGKIFINYRDSDQSSDEFLFEMEKGRGKRFKLDIKKFKEIVRKLEMGKLKSSELIQLFVILTISPALSAGVSDTVVHYSDFEQFM
ncbi:hypothetical protein NAEGRDRAFT_54420 [Naegleria gruberi]|uniref:F-box domain-containing protein n=1 Tax=Naegleria gruberi TaxID=5762 RepID=D2W3H5_NAEGR|nr:uncharacterized protein NAEGRDRAFT_54420 [Naegleria gruberi]EFC36423.1 hypothetical protein NAEGRDRAFT_54420 [Naegleria gruberi]|eukprot:XP_002669167.1 hypothetical protein NAEGRDRAFT_54420 [Naegleria gruberi strain NEG-M]